MKHFILLSLKLIKYLHIRFRIFLFLPLLVFFLFPVPFSFLLHCDSLKLENKIETPFKWKNHFARRVNSIKFENENNVAKCCERFQTFLECKRSIHQILWQWDNSFREREMFQKGKKGKPRHGSLVLFLVFEKRESDEMWSNNLQQQTYACQNHSTQKYLISGLKPGHQMSKENKWNQDIVDLNMASYAA